MDQEGNPNLAGDRYLTFGDPSVETWTSGGRAHFYIGSLYDSLTGGKSYISINARGVSGTGAAATLASSQAITDVHVVSQTTAPSTGRRVFVAWSDGRLGMPQPFEANATTP